MNARLSGPLIACVLAASCTLLPIGARDKHAVKDSAAPIWDQTLDDQAIEAHSMMAIREADPGLATAALTVSSSNGIVLLTGQVSTPELRALAAQQVSRFAQLRRIHNALRVAPPLDFEERNADAWISTRIKAEMLFSTTLDPTSVVVVTEAGTVYLMGEVAGGVAARLEKIASDTEGVAAVVNLLVVSP